MKPAVLIARALLPAGTDLLRERFELREGGLDASREHLDELAAGVAAIVADASVPVDAALLDRAGPELRLVANFAVGYDNVDLEACRARGVRVTNTPGVLSNATAELALALTLAAARQVPRMERKLRAGEWKGWDPGADLGIELSGATFAVVGLGRIGRRYAELVRPLAGRLLYVARSDKPDAEAELAAERASLAEALAAADVVSLHVPGGEETRGLIGAAELERMRDDAILVNTARGPTVDSLALATALRQGVIGAVGLDVYEDEPNVTPELLDVPNAVLLPHVGSATTRARDAMARTVAENVIAVLEGREPPNPVV